MVAQNPAACHTLTIMKLLSCKCAEKWSDVAPLVLRLAVGAVFIVHGYSKVVDVAAFEGMLASISVPLPAFFAWVVTLVELLGGAALILGLLTHWAAKLIAIDMLVAILLIHWKNGFMVSGGGAEFALVLFAAAVALTITGAGKWSVDQMWHKKS